MDPTQVKQAIIKALSKVQLTQGFVCPAFTDGMRPAQDLEKFGSKEQYVAAKLIAKELSIEILPNRKIFTLKKEPITLEQVVGQICTIYEEIKEKDGQ